MSTVLWGYSIAERPRKKEVFCSLTVYTYSTEDAENPR